ncbi:MAG: MATE family efflux transporter [Lachnospiraceae bacterium]|nr:MATE family efflux transporter [Lachnospiraceae bacterium]
MKQFFKSLFSDKEFLRRTWLIVLPVTIQQMLAMLTNIVDNVMIGRLGEIEMGGVGLASKVFFIICLSVFGVSSGMSVLSSQYWGNNDIPNIRRVVGLGGVLSVGFALTFSVICFFFPDKAMMIFTDSPELINVGAIYLRITAFSWPFMALSETLATGLRSMDIVKPRVCVIAIAIVVNIFFNWILIFGRLGAPELEVAGAAYATVIARFAEAVMMIVMLRIIDSPLWCDIKCYFGFTKNMLAQFVNRSMAVCINDTLWGIGYSLHALTYGRMGEAAAAAFSVVSIFSDIEVVGLLGLSTACAVILGNELGAGHMHRAELYAKYYIVLGFMAGIVICIITALAARPAAEIYNFSVEAKQMMLSTLAVLAISLLWRADNNITIVGILRAGGDTKACALIDLLPMWLVSVPAVILTGLGLHWPLWAVYLVQQSDEFIKLFASMSRVRTKKWLKNLNVELAGQI